MQKTFITLKRVSINIHTPESSLSFLLYLLFAFGSMQLLFPSGFILFQSASSLLFPSSLGGTRFYHLSLTRFFCHIQLSIDYGTIITTLAEAYTQSQFCPLSPFQYISSRYRFPFLFSFVIMSVPSRTRAVCKPLSQDAVRLSLNMTEYLRQYEDSAFMFSL
jgi:hypothetical protein